MSDDVGGNRAKRAADGLASATAALGKIDLNALDADDVRAVLDHKAALTEMCLRYRRDQRAGERAHTVCACDAEGGQ